MKLYLRKNMILNTNKDCALAPQVMHNKFDQGVSGITVV